MLYLCCDEHRREAVRAQRTLKGIDFNGIDYLEVSDTHALKVHFVHPLVTEPSRTLGTDVLSKDNVSITGGERIRDVAVVKVHIGELPDVLIVKVDKPGDLSTYTLHLKSDPHLLRLDPLLSKVDFTFATSPNIDCQMGPPCQPELPETPEIDYLAKDFASFRQLMLDRLATLMPQWKERSAADIGVVLVELLAYVADHLSYQQDVIATESYLSTARRRISVRRHARLLEYFISEGCNARVWVQVRVNQNILRQSDDEVAPLQKGTRLLTRVAGQSSVLLPEVPSMYPQAQSLQVQPPEVFETMCDVDRLLKDHNELYFYTWGARECCLPRGATRATLRGSLGNLQPGDILIFKEVIGAHTGAPEDAEPAHRHAIRLTSVTITQDPLGAWTTGKKDQERIEEDVRITEKDRIVEDIAYRRGDDIVREEHAIEETHVIEEKRVIEGDQIVVDQIEEKDTIIEEDDEDTQELPFLRSEMHQEREEHRGKGARRKDRRKRGKKKHEDEEEIVEVEEFEEEKHTEVDTKEVEEDETTEKERTVDVITKRTVEEEFVSEKGIGFEEKLIITETHTVEEEDIKKQKEPDYSIDITEIEWHYEDALPFPLCISATTDYEYGHRYLENVSIALGNIVLADHGRTLQETLTPVPASTLHLASTGGNRCEDRQEVPVPARFYPSLKYAPLTYTSPYDASSPPASAWAMMQLSAHNAVPAIRLEHSSNTLDPATVWLSKGDLLNSKPVDRHFIVENDNDGRAYLRFGDDQHGLRPTEGTAFTPVYRVGNGVRGNVGQEALYHIVSNDSRIDGVSNPLSASGGVEPESIEDVRQKISRAFLTQERGVTPEDYKEIAERHPEIHRANAVLRWTGSWYTVFLVVERVASMPVDDAFKRDVRQYMERFRMAGGDIIVVSPVYVSLEIAMTVTVRPDYFRSNVRAALLEVFSSRQWPDGQRGIFYPDNYSFGQPVYLNPLYVAAINVPGVASVDITAFQRQGIPGSGLLDGVLTLDWLELVRLENDPNYPEHGIFVLNVKDGK